MTVDLENIISRYKIFVDTSMLMHPGAEEFFLTVLAPALRKAGAGVLLPGRVVKEIEGLMQDGEKERLARAAARIVNQYRKGGLADIRHEDSDGYADNVFLATFTRHRLQHALALLTQDKALAMDILDLNAGSRSVQRVVGVISLRLDRFGRIQYWRPEKTPATVSSSSGSLPGTSGSMVAMVAASPLRLPLAQDIPPTTGEFVHAARSGMVLLGQKLGTGGEGEVYATDSQGMVAKLYHAKRLDRKLADKLMRMFARPLVHSGVCWPLEPLTEDGTFVGCLMPEARGVTLQRGLFGKMLLSRNFPGWTRKDLVKVAINVLEGVIRLHRHGVLLGDINPNNILVDRDGSVCFVDLDSCQIDDIPCPVGMVTFTPPELQGKKYGELLRSPAHEAFALATLLFMILLPGKAPYSCTGGGSPGANIRNGNFPYPFGGKGAQNPPAGAWRYIWSHLPYRVKEVFYNCFQNGARPTPEEWLKLMRDYAGGLDQGWFSDELFPGTFKAASDYARERYGTESSFVTAICAHPDCGKPFSLSRDKAARLDPKRVYCPTCLAAFTMEARCADCGRTCKAVGATTSPSRCRICETEAERRLAREENHTYVTVTCGCRRRYVITREEMLAARAGNKALQCNVCRMQAAGVRQQTPCRVQELLARVFSFFQ